MADGSKSDAMAQCEEILQYFMSREDAEPFLEPVRWKEWGLDDYPKVIKHPMDFGLIHRKLKAGEYSSPVEFESDCMLVFRNCMVYNQDGSDYYLLAENLMKAFQERFASVKAGAADKTGAGAKPPTLQDKRGFTQNVYAITAEELGKLVQLLDTRCGSAIRKVDSDDIEVDVDAIDSQTFWIADEFVKSCVAAGAKKGAGGAAKKGRPRKA